MPYLDMILCTLLLFGANITDFREKTIKNWMTVPFMVLGIINTLLLYGVYDGFISMLWLIPAFIICYVLFKFKQIGGGDVKLILAVGAIMGMNYTLYLLTTAFFVSWGFILGGVIFKKKSIKNNEIQIPMGVMMFIAQVIMIVNILVK